MCYWTDCSIYTRNIDDLRILIDLIRVQCGSAIGKQIYSTTNAREARNPFTIDNNERPALIAVLIAMLEPENVSTNETASSADGASMSSLYPNSIKMATMIVERKDVSPNMADASKDLSWWLGLMLQELYRQRKQNPRAMLPTKIKLRIQLFSETMIRAAQIYRETLFRNRILWDPTELGFIGTTAASEFNLGFDTSYIELAILDLCAQNVSVRENNSPAMKEVDTTYDDLPGLIRDS